jgi:Fe-S-cluster containining protein
MLPLVQELSDRIVNATCQVVEAQGQKVSCQKGCGACCRQLVPISEEEARHIHDLVLQLPEPRRTEILGRFAQARQKLQDANLLESLSRSEEWTDETYLSLATRYFDLQIPCPFLEDESCSIHPQRPITCREYLVTSPAENCSHPTPETIQRIRLPLRVFNAIARFNVPSSRPFLEGWVPLIMAPEWAKTHPSEPPPRPGPELLRELLHHLRHQEDEHSVPPTPPVPHRRTSLPPMAISTGPHTGSSTTAEVTLSSTDWQLQTKVTVPNGPIRTRHMLPMVQALADRVVDAATETARSQGHKVSCTKGCGACCRQLVPIGELEARNIHDVVERMPEPRRSTIRARFAEARQRLEETGLLKRLAERDEWREGESRALGLQYFGLGIACPFLEEESCSIYHDRPIACREYLVTSPAENCSRPTPETVKMVPLPFRIWTAMARVDDESRRAPWVPLILALEWAEAHPDESTPRPGPQLLRSLFDEITHQSKISGGGV